MGRAVDVTIDNGAPITLVSQTLGHVDLKTTRVYAHARPNESSSRYLKNGSAMGKAGPQAGRQR